MFKLDISIQEELSNMTEKQRRSYILDEIFNKNENWQEMYNFHKFLTATKDVIENIDNKKETEKPTQDSNNKAQSSPMQSTIPFAHV